MIPKSRIDPIFHIIIDCSVFILIKYPWGRAYFNKFWFTRNIYVTYLADLISTESQPCKNTTYKSKDMKRGVTNFEVKLISSWETLLDFLEAVVF